MRLLRSLALACLCLAVCGQASAADYPTRAVKLIVPLAPGGPVDNVARGVVDHLSTTLKQPFVVENRPGAGGNLGINAAINAPADGHTLLLALGAMLTINPSLYKPVPFDPETQLRPISLLTLSTQTLVVHPSVPATSLGEFVALARKERLTYGISGYGTPSHLTMEYLKSMAGFDATAVSYRGASQIAIDLLAGQVHGAFAATASVINHVKEGRLRALAISGARRSQLLPEVPTVAELYPGYDFGSTILVLAPAGTPDEIVTMLEREFRRAVSDPRFGAAFRANDMEPIGSTSVEARQWIGAETRRWSEFLKRANLQIN